MTRPLINFAAFYIGWFACVGGAGRGMTLIGPVVVGALLALHLFLVEDPWSEARLIVATGVLGWSIDTAQALLGVFSFGTRSPLPWLCPLWLVAIWMNFATTLTVSMRRLAGRYVLAALLGAISGPLSYSYGVRLGAMEFNPHPIVSLACLAVVWGVTMPLLIWMTATFVPVVSNHTPVKGVLGASTE